MIDDFKHLFLGQIKQPKKFQKQRLQNPPKFLSHPIGFNCNKKLSLHRFNRKVEL